MLHKHVRVNTRGAEEHPIAVGRPFLPNYVLHGDLCWGGSLDQVSPRIAGTPCISSNERRRTGTFGRKWATDDIFIEQIITSRRVISRRCSLALWWWFYEASTDISMFMLVPVDRGHLKVEMQAPNSDPHISPYAYELRRYAPYAC